MAETYFFLEDTATLTQKLRPPWTSWLTFNVFRTDKGVTELTFSLNESAVNREARYCEGKTRDGRPVKITAPHNPAQPAKIVVG